VLVGVGLGGLALLMLLLRGAWPHLSAEERRHCRWLAAGAGLSLLPVASSMPMSRLLLVPSLGASVLLSVVLLQAWRAWKPGWRPRGVALAGGVLVLFHLVLAPLSWPAMTMAIRQLSAGTEQLAQQAAGELDLSRVASQRVVLLGARDPGVALYVPMFWALRGQPLPRSWWPLALVPEPTFLTRTGPVSFELTLPPGKHFLASEAEQSIRGPAHRLDTGATVQLEGMRVTILAADAEGPTRLGFEFEVPLEDPSLVFLRFQDGALRRFTPPPVGERLAVGAAP
jgi:hypothetical protein